MVWFGHILHTLKLGDKVMWKKIKPYVISIAIALGVGALSALVTRDGMQEFQNVIQPPLSPPPWLFPIVWTILFTLMGIGAAMVYETGKGQGGATAELIIYAFSLAINFFWTIIFFNMQDYLFAFIWLIVLLLAVIYTAYRFYKVNKTAGLLQIPYILWLMFALYLNYMIWTLNT